MKFSQGLLLCYVLSITSFQGAFADTEDKSEETGTDQEIQFLPNDNSSSLEVGPPDSHEAMNNRELNVNTRKKRSYKFLLGLIKNNTKYEVTRSDPSPTAQEDNASAEASEILLELLVKIAAHPDHWTKVHNLLERIDSDLLASKKLVDDLQKAKIELNPKTPPNKKDDEETISKKNNFSTNNEWPVFANNMEMHDDKNGKINYPRTFAYQRVTGRPMYLNKNPKAYIAVSVIAPKPMNAHSKEEDFILEKELRQLKPWTHNQNLKNMASIRSRWVIQTDDNNKNYSVAP